MSPEAIVEAIVRLHAVAGEGRDWGRKQLRADLRALLDAHAEALDALEAQGKYGCLCAMAEEGDPGVCGQCAMRAAVLAKAGRR